MLLIIVIVLGVLLLCTSMLAASYWAANRVLANDKIELENENEDLREKIFDNGLRAFEVATRLQEERDNALDNLAVVLKADPIPFNHVAVELGLHGVVYQFHSLDPKEITA